MIEQQQTGTIEHAHPDIAGLRMWAYDAVKCFYRKGEDAEGSNILHDRMRWADELVAWLLRP